MEKIRSIRRKQSKKEAKDRKQQHITLIVIKFLVFITTQGKRRLRMTKKMDLPQSKLNYECG